MIGRGLELAGIVRCPDFTVFVRTFRIDSALSSMECSFGRRPTRGPVSHQLCLKYDVRHTQDENSLRMVDKQLKRPMLCRREKQGAINK